MGRLRARIDVLENAGRAPADLALVLLADDGDDIVTSDADDLKLLVGLLGRHVELLHA